MKSSKEIACEYKDALVEYRRKLHASPELTNREYNTHAWILGQMKQFGIPVKSGISGNSVVAYIDSGRPGKCIAFRADIDALPIQEMNDVPYKSTVPDVMHACGHDAHTAILMCLANALADNNDLINGKVVFLFQQAEEGGDGAETLVKDGALDGVDRIFALHVDSGSPVGTITTGAGVQYASNESFSIEITGRGTHGATPHNGIDPITAGCSIISEIYLIKSKLIDPLEQFVINVCQFTAGKAANVVPEKALIRGTVRCFSNAVRQNIKSHIQSICKSIGEMKGCSCEVRYDHSVPVVINSEDETTLVTEAIAGLGYTVFDNQPPKTVSEDFACMLEKVPGCIFGLGSGNIERGITAPHHSPLFDIDEDCLLIGLESMLEIYRRAV